ncbi:MAG TPA: NADH-quinone oxidoreductase subunit D [Thermoanaerobaculia bacterium]|nr:NADH-quinone oxidoreductase subunit D [Thermoanaerobaculia bacterium]
MTTTPDSGTMLNVREMEINFGPQHPSTHGVLRVVLKVDGERILEAKPVIGYLHRGTEKLFENMNYPQCVPHTDRMDYVAAATNNLGFVETIEKIMGIREQIPRRVQIIRVILSELQRISSHLLWLATHAIDLGAMTPFFYTFREREEVLDLFEEYCGARLTLNCMKIGGQPYEATPAFLEHVAAFAAKFDAACDEYEALLTNNRIWRRRTVGIGVLSPEDAIDWGVTGPPLRGSGVDWDLRKVRPYEIYSELDFEVPLGKNGDTYDRYLVRMEEMRQSTRLLRQCLEKIAETPEGDLKAKISRVIRPPEGEVYHSIESPKGELGYYVVSDGKSQVGYRIHVRPPSFINLQALPALAKGHLVSDLVALIGTIDIVLGEVDR